MTRVEAHDIRWAPGGVVLDGVSVDVTAGTFCALLGPNGCGKTSLLRSLARVLRPDTGQVLLDGAAIDGARSRDLGRRRALVSQDQPTDLDLTVLDVALIGRTPHKGRTEPDGADDVEVAEHSLDRVELTHLRHRTIPTLSGGERQRTFIARAFTQEAPVLLLDEPTNHLDLRHQHKLLAELQETPTTVIASLHDPQLATTYADQVVVLSGGRVAAAGVPGEVLTPDLLGLVWGVAAVVDHDASGRARISITGVL